MAAQSSNYAIPAEWPVALMASNPRGGQIVARSSAAAEQGILKGMPVAEAQALVPQLSIMPREPTADRRTLEKLAEACEQFTPCVALEEADEPECLLLDISNLEHLWSSEQVLAAQVKSFFTRRGYQVRIAVAPTVGLAWALAHFDGEPASAGGEEAEDCKLKIAESPVPSPQPPAPSLPVEALRIPPDTAALLRQLGITTIGQLVRLPREDLASRFGDQLLRRLDQFTGAALEVIELHRGLPALRAAHALEEPTADRAMLLHVLAQLLQRLTRQLAARDEGAVRLVCALYLQGRLSQAADLPSRRSGVCDGYVPLRIDLLEPSANAGHLLELIELHLETVKLPDEVDRVEIRAAVVGRLRPRQGELFTDRWPADRHQLPLLVNRLSSRLGHEHVLRAELHASPVPERAVRYVAMTAETKRKGKGGRGRVKGRRDSCLAPPSSFRLPPLARPMLLHPQPQSLEIVCVAPDGPPQFLWLQGRRERIVHCVGPERIETLWWGGPSVRRDYYRIATESGNHLWIFRQLTNARWFLHGTFD